MPPQKESNPAKQAKLRSDLDMLLKLATGLVDAYKVGLADLFEILNEFNSVSKLSNSAEKNAKLLGVKQKMDENLQTLLKLYQELGPYINTIISKASKLPLVHKPNGMSETSLFELLAMDSLNLNAAAQSFTADVNYAFVQKRLGTLNSKKAQLIGYAQQIHSRLVLVRSAYLG